MNLKEPVLTTKYVIESQSKIVFVYHNEQGWQFFGNEKNIIESDGRVVSLDTIISLNPHVKEILWIAPGMEAWINSSGIWQTASSIGEVE